MDFAARYFASAAIKTASESAWTDLGRALPVALAMTPLMFYKGFAEELLTKKMTRQLSSLASKSKLSPRSFSRRLGKRISSPDVQMSLGRGFGKSTTGFATGLVQTALLSRALG